MQDFGTPAHWGRRRAPRSRTRRALLGAAAIVGLAGVGSAAAFAYARTTQSGGGPLPEQVVVTSPTRAQTLSAARSFLSAWSHADLTAAAQATDQPQSARPGLRSYQNGLEATAVTFTGITVGAPDPAVPHTIRVSFHATATLGGAGSFGYTGAVDVLDVNGAPRIHWTPDVVYPGLKAGQKLELGSIPTTSAGVVDRHGRPLTSTAYPSLAGVITELRTAYAATVERTPGRGVEIVDTAGKTLKVLKTVRPGTAGTIRTTLDANLQAAAESAVKDSHIATMPADVVAIDYTTGEIRAVAFRGGDAALNGAAAPGSTMKMITSAALFDKAGVRPTDKAPCVKDTVIDGQTFHNFQGESDPAADLTKDFAISCNTAFIDEATSKLRSGDLRQEARDVFGIGDWKIGVPTTDGNVPDENGSRNLIAAQSIGQGRVSMNTLAMASVVATIADGAFHQPVLVPGLAQPSARRPISGTTASEIRSMMIATATQPYGTAQPRMTGIPGGAKTGTAETASGTNGWFAAYDRTNHLAVDALVIGGKEGVLTAGYVARDVMLAG